MTFLFRSRRSAANREIVDRLNGGVVEAARQPAFYAVGGVPDTFEGRFELMVLHAALAMRRLRQEPTPGPEVAQALVDAIFRNLDPALRELGVGDLAVPKRMKHLAEAFLGRAVAYAAALDGDEPAALAAALSRNVLGGRAAPPGLPAYVRAAAAALRATSFAALLDGPLPFPEAAAFLAEDKP